MTPRRVAFIGIRLIALFLAIRGIERLVELIGTVRNSPAGPERAQLLAAAVPVVAAVVLWLAAVDLAARLSDQLLMTSGEIDRALAEEDETGPPADETETDDFSEGVDEEEDEGAVGRARPWLVVALMVLGANAAIRGIELVMVGLPQMIWHARYTCSGFFRPRATTDCPFWDAISISAAATIASGLVAVAAGMLLLLRPAALIRWVEALRGRAAPNREV